jgi:hypothetical protein
MTAAMTKTPTPTVSGWAKTLRRLQRDEAGNEPDE